MRSEGLWQLASALAFFGATSIACIGPCDDEEYPIVSGEYVIVEQLYANSDASDDWTREVLPGAQLSIDADGYSATIVYEREGTTYQVVYDLEDW